MLTKSKYPPHEKSKIDKKLEVTHLLEVTVSDDSKTGYAKLATMLTLNNCSVFRFAAANGLLDVLKVQWRAATPELRNAMLTANNYDAFISSAINGHVHITNFLWKNANANQQTSMITANHCISFIESALCDRLVVVNRLWELATPAQRLAIQQTLAANNFITFRIACAYGLLRIVNRLWKIATTPEQRRAMLAANNQEAFRLAAINGHLPAIKRIRSLTEDDLIVDLKTYENLIINGHLDVLDNLLEIDDEIVSKDLARDNFAIFRNITSNELRGVYAAFRLAAAYAHFNVLELLFDLLNIPVQRVALQNAIALNNYEACKVVISNGNLLLLEKLLTIVPTTQKNALIQALRADYHAIFIPAVESAYFNMNEMFISASLNGSLNTFNLLLEVASPDQKAVMLQTLNDGEAFKRAIYGNIAMVNRLWELATPAQKTAMMQAVVNNNYAELLNVAMQDNAGMINRLWELMTLAQRTALLQVVIASNYSVFVNISNYAHFELLRHLWVIASPEQRTAIVAAILSANLSFSRCNNTRGLEVIKRILNDIPDFKEIIIQLKCIGAHGHRALLALSENPTEQEQFIKRLSDTNSFQESPERLIVRAIS